MRQNTDSDPPFHLHLHHQHQPPYSISHSFLSGLGVGADGLLCPQSLAFVENFLRPRIQEEVEAKVKAHFNPCRPSCSNSSTSGKEVGEDHAVGGGGSRKENHLKLRFKNKISSIIFTKNEIEAENGEEVQVELFDVVNDCVVDTTHPLSFAWVEVVVLCGEFDDEEAITQSDFEKSVVSQRLGERPLVVGDGKRFRLKNGVSSITNLSFTTNSSRSRSKKIQLGLRLKHDSNSNNNPTVQYAVSNPFRVKDHRGQLNKKHHPPRGEDEVWRLEGIGRNGKYHKRLASQGVETVDSFVKAHQRDYRSLRKLLGNRVSDKIWKTMVNHALEYVPPINVPTFDLSNFEENLVQNEAVYNQNIGASNGNGFQDQTWLGDFQDLFYNPILRDYYPTPTLLSHGEASTSNAQNNHVENTSTCNQYFQGAWNKLVPKPK